MIYVKINSNISNKLELLAQKTKNKRDSIKFVSSNKSDNVINSELNDLEKDIYSTIK